MPNEYSDLIAEDKTNDLRQSVFVAARQQPDTEAKLQALSERTGVPLDAVRLKPADVELHDRLQSFDYEKAIKESPKLSAWLADPKNAGVAHDDVDNLTGLEKTLRFGANAGRALGSVPHQMSSNLWGVGRAVGDVLPDFIGDPIANFAARYQKGASQTARDIRGTQAGAGFVEKSVYSGIESLGQNLAMLPLTIASGGAAPMLTGMGLTTGGQAYGQARDKGVSVPQSLTFAASQGGIEVATEMLPALTMLKAVGLKTGFGKMLAKSMAQEIPGEQVATLFQDLNEWAVLNPDKPFQSYLDERPSAFAQTLIATIVGTGGQIAVAKAAENHFGGEVQKQREQFFQALADQSGSSKLRERLPDRFKALVEKYTEDGPVQNVFVPADKFAEYFQSVGIDPMAAAEEAGAVNFREAFASGGDVVIPMADFAAHIAPTEHLNGLMQDLRLRQDEMTSRELALAEANRDPDEQAMMDEAAKIGVELGNDAKLDQAIQRIVTDVEGQLNARYDQNTARQMATVMRGMAVLATRANPNADPVQAAQALWSKYGLNIRANPLPEVLRKAPDFDATIDPMLDRLRRGDLPSQQEMFGASLIDWLREQGGLKDQGGELAARDAKLWDREKRKGGQRRLMNDNGLDFDAARELAVQAGFDVGTTEADFIDAIDREISGDPVFAAGHGDDTVRRIADQLDGLARALSEMGVDLTTMDNAAVKQLLRGGESEFDQRSGSLADVVAQWESLGIKNAVFERNGVITLSQIIVPEDGRGKGAGTAAMQALIDYADQSGQRIVLSPSSDFVGNKKRLVEFYKRFGFVENKGRNKDFTTMESMYRDPQSDRTLFQPAFHGSPHRFSKFSLEHLGTGEGAQAYGWGLYFAGNKEVAEWYRDNLSSRQGADPTNDKFDGKTVMEWYQHWSDKADRASDPTEFYDRMSMLEETELNWNPQAALNTAIEDELNPKAIEWFKKTIADKMARPGATYEVSIPEDDTMLLWDKPLSEQPEKVREELSGFKFPDAKMTGGEMYAFIRNEIAESSGERGRGPDFYKGFAEQASKELNSLGISGIKYLDGTSRADGDGSYNYVIFDDAAVEILNTYYQDKRGSIQFGSDRKFQINLFEKADLSTFLHESGHFYLEVLGDLADDPQADQSVRDDYAKILAFLGVSTRAEIQTEHHEKFARANELYLFEGKAPAPELRGVFQRFRAWLKVIYRELSRLNVDISDEVRGVFDRIYATDAEIEQASREAQIEHLFLDAASAGMTDAEFAAYSGTVADTTAEAKETLQTKLMRVEKLKRESWWREQRKAVAAEVAAEFDDTPAAQVFDVLTAPDSELKLSRSALVERYGEQILKQLPRGYGEGRGAVYTNDGADLDSVAEVSGFDSADAMISALVNMPNRKRFIAAESDRRMMERHGDLLNDVALADEAMQALHNEKREQVLKIELRALNKQIKGEQVPPESLRAMAAGIIGQKQVRDINPHSYLLAEQKAARAAFKEMAEGGNRVEAFKQKQRELLNHYLYREASKARTESDAILKYMKSFESDSMRGKLGKAGDQYLDQIDGILERYEFKRVTNRDLSRRDSLSAWLAAQEAAGNAVNVPEEIQNDARRMNYRTVPMDELRAIRDAVKNIAHLANLKTKLVRKGKLVEFEGVVSELLGALDAAGFSSTGDIGKTSTKSDSIVAKAAAGWRKFDAAHMKVEQVVEWLDGGKIDGPWARYLFDLADDAQTQEYDLHRLVTTKIQSLAEHLDKKTLTDRTTVTLPGFDKPMTRYDLLSIAMNMGNAQNVQRLQDGYGWSDADLQRVRDALSLSDWKFVQGVWDAIDQLWEPMAALEKRASGLEPERVVPVEFEAQGETFRGGYFPLVYDPRRSNAGEKQADADESVQNFIAQGYGRASTNKGATKARAENFAAPVMLDYEHVIAGHMAKVIKDISHREAIIGINKILTQPQIKEGIIDKLGEGQYQEFRKWMQVLVNDRSDSLTEATGAGKWMMKFRTNTAIVTMGFKISTMMAQIAGIGPTLDTVKPREFAKALTQFVSSPRETWGLVTGKSGEMRNRANTMERDVRDALLRMRGEGGFLADVRRHAFILTAMADRVISGPTWLAGYNGALADGLAEEDAIRAGDRAVRLSQGAGGSKDLAAVQRSNELMKLITMYYTPFSVLYARLRDIGHQASTQGIGYMPAAAARLIALVILPAVLGDILAGRGPDDDEDETWWAIRKSLLYPVATLPVIRDFAGYMEAGIISASGEGKMKFPPSYKLSPVVGAIEKTIRTGGNVLIGNDSKTSSEIAWDAFEVSGYMFGLPTAQPRITGEYLTDLLSGDADPENAPQLLHDALFRRDKSK